MVYQPDWDLVLPVEMGKEIWYIYQHICWRKKLFKKQISFSFWTGGTEYKAQRNVQKKREISYSSSLFQGAEAQQLILQEQTPLWMRTQPVMLISLLHIVVSRREQVTVFLLVLRSEVELLERLWSRLTMLTLHRDWDHINLTQLWHKCDTSSQVRLW